MVIKWTKQALSDLDDFRKISKKSNVSAYIMNIIFYIILTMTLYI